MSEKEIKELVKEAELRSDDDAPCPFAMCISSGACRLVGDLIEKMAPVNCLGDESSEDEEEEIKAANQYLYRWQCPGTKCLYADKVFGGITQCTFGDGAAQGLRGNGIMGSPFYWKMFSGVGMDGLYSYPLGYYTDNSIDRGMYYGMYSIESMGSKKDNISIIVKGSKLELNKEILDSWRHEGWAVEDIGDGSWGWTEYAQKHIPYILRTILSQFLYGTAPEEARFYTKALSELGFDKNGFALYDEE